MSEQSKSQPKQRVDITPIKKWALSNLPKTSLLKPLILSQKDSLQPEEYLAKAEEWLRLLRLEEEA